MTADPKSIDLPSFVAEHLERAEPDLLRSMLKTFVEALMSTEADALCGAEYGSRSPERVITRKGIGRGSGTPGPARLRWGSRSCGLGRTSRIGCSSVASARSGRW